MSIKKLEITLRGTGKEQEFCGGVENKTHVLRKEMGNTEYQRIESTLIIKTVNCALCNAKFVPYLVQTIPAK